MKIKNLKNGNLRIVKLFEVLKEKSNKNKQDALQGFPREWILLSINCGPSNFRVIPRKTRRVARNSPQRNSDWKWPNPNKRLKSKSKYLLFFGTNFGLKICECLEMDNEQYFSKLTNLFVNDDVD